MDRWTKTKKWLDIQHTEGCMGKVTQVGTTKEWQLMQKGGKRHNKTHEKTYVKGN